VCSSDLTRRNIGFLLAKLKIKKIEELRGVLYGKTRTGNFEIHDLC
jgi:hypothetical protein